jgi:hypothetical protein
MFIARYLLACNTAPKQLSKKFPRQLFAQSLFHLPANINWANVTGLR